MNTRTFPALSLLTLGGLSLIGVILLAATGHPIPDVLPTLATVSLSALAGVAVPSFSIASPPPSSSSQPPSTSPPAAAAASPAGPVYLVASQAPATADVNTPAGGGGIHIAGGVIGNAA